MHIFIKICHLTAMDSQIYSILQLLNICAWNDCLCLKNDTLADLFGWRRYKESHNKRNKNDLKVLEEDRNTCSPHIMNERTRVAHALYAYTFRLIGHLWQEAYYYASYFQAAKYLNKSKTEPETRLPAKNECKPDYPERSKKKLNRNGRKPVVAWNIIRITIIAVHLSHPSFGHFATFSARYFSITALMPVLFWVQTNYLIGWRLFEVYVLHNKQISNIGWRPALVLALDKNSI